MAKGMKRRMMMGFLVVSSLGLLASPAFAQQSSDKVVRLDRPFTDQETGRVYDCRYAVGEEAKVLCYELAYSQERYGFTVVDMTVVNERVTRRALQDPWFDEQRRDLERRWQEQRRREQQRRQWERSIERDQELQRMGQPDNARNRQAKERPAQVSSGSEERRAPARRGTQERRERRRPRGGGDRDRGGR
jgi:hypothetical protein